MAWCRMCGSNGGQSTFVYVGTLKTWSNGLNFNVPSHATSSTEQIDGTGLMPSNCKMYYIISYSGLGGYNSDVINVSVRPHWTTEYTVISVKTLGQSGSGSITDTVDLSTYAGQNLDIKVSCYNAGSGNGSCQINRLDINNAVSIIYNDGVENTALTGGLTNSGYSVSTYHPNTGPIAFGANDISLTTNLAPQACLFGTLNKINLTSIGLIRVTTIINNSEQTFSLDVSTINTEKYISFGTMDNNDNRLIVLLIASDTKTNVYTDSGSIQSIQQISTTTLLVKKIELI